MSFSKYGNLGLHSRKKEKLRNKNKTTSDDKNGDEREGEREEQY